MWILTCFCYLFLLNETVRFVQNVVVSYIVQQKKKTQTMPFWTELWVFFFPWTCEAREEAYFSSPCFHRFLSYPSLSKHQKDADHNPTCINSDSSATTGRWKTEGMCPSSGFWGGCTVATPASLPPVFRL